MLTGLKIENIAVIESAELEFDSGLNVLTGETGAGKSIIIDSINAVLGERTSRELIRTGLRAHGYLQALPMQARRSRLCSSAMISSRSRTGLSCSAVR